MCVCVCVCLCVSVCDHSLNAVSDAVIYYHTAQDVQPYRTVWKKSSVCASLQICFNLETILMVMALESVQEHSCYSKDYANKLSNHNGCKYDYVCVRACVCKHVFDFVLSE